MLVTYVPCGHTESVLAALFAAGAGAIGDYRDCAFVVTGRGRFRALDGADPAIGAVGEVTFVEEDRLEVVLARSDRAAVLAALLAAHPYEQPAYHVIESAT